MKTVLAIDMGNSYISIYKKNCGIVLKEPNLIAVSGSNSNYKIIAFGNEAKKLQGKTAENVVIFTPISEGEVKSREYLSALLKHFLEKLEINKLSKIKALVTIPCGISSQAKDVYRKTCFMAGIDEVRLIPSIIAGAVGSGRNIRGDSTTFIASFGGGVTEVAVLNLNSIVKGGTLAYGGRALDVAIATAIAEKYQVLVGVSSAGKIKEEVGSLYENDTLNLEVSGVNVSTKSPQNIIVFSKDIRSKLVEYVDEVLKLIETTLNLCPPEISADITQDGLLLVGGGAKLVGLAEYISRAIKMPCTVSDYAENATILGAGKLLSDEQELKAILDNVGG